MLETRITKMLGIQHPIVLSGMTWVSLPKLVAAVCNAGGLGIFATGAKSFDEVRENIREIKSLTNKPFGVNLGLLLPGVEKMIQVTIEEKVPVINYAMGRPDELVKTAHAYGAIVIGTVAHLKHAVRAERGGADALIVTGFEAGGHLGELSTSVLVPLVASNVKVPIIAAGGFCDGRGLVAALALGADGISMGTRFIMTKESIIHQRMKKRVLESDGEDTMATDRFDGIPCRFIKTVGLNKMLERRFSVKDAMLGALHIKQAQGVSTWELFNSAFKIRREGIPVQRVGDLASGLLRAKAGITEGDEEYGIYSCGQVAGRIDDIPSCSELIERIITEAEYILAALNRKLVKSA
jgi:enoyl-[acyl-carrier protein] reductase II